MGHAASRVVTGWLYEPRFDLSFILGIALLATSMASVTVLWPDWFWPMLTVHTWLFGYEHLVATYTRLFGRPEERARFRWLTFLVPPLVLLGLYSVGRAYGILGVYVLYFVGQLHHTVRQSWGLAQQYRHRAGGLPWDRPWLSQTTLWSVAVWGFLHRCAQQPTEFLFQPFWLPSVPRLWVTLSAGLSIGLWLYWLVQRIAAYRRGELAVGHTLYMLSHFVVYVGGYVLIDELCSGWLLVNVWHNVQYIVFVWLYNRRRFGGGIDPQAQTLSWLSQPGVLRVALYGLASIALALPFYYLLPRLGMRLDAIWTGTLVPSAITLGLTLTFHHYIVDAVVWKRRNNPSAV
ncbi:MAG: hypothetical protein JNJ46_21915 [Myxococcales bacterium]|nr:hypothetical protein [Myxococcales bacterium]